MDGFTLKNDPTGTLSGFAADALGVADGWDEPGERTRGAATAQTTRTSAANVAKTARAKNSDRLPQTGLTYLILTCKRYRYYAPFEGGRRV
jgi:hypothetical protein